MAVEWIQDPGLVWGGSDRKRQGGHDLTRTLTMAPKPPARPLPGLFLLSLVPVAAWFVVRPLLDPPPPLPVLFVSVGFSLFAFLAALYLIPALGPRFIQANLKGKDLLKVYQDPM